MHITIPDIPPSNNTYLGNSHNFNAYRREKEKWYYLVRAAIGELPKEPMAQANVRIVYYFADARRRDPDNYSGKMILDPLVRLGVLSDDSFDSINLTVIKGGIDRIRPRIEVFVEELEA